MASFVHKLGTVRAAGIAVGVSLAAHSAQAQTPAPGASSGAGAAVQAVRVNGVVQRAGADSARPVAGVWVVLHRVARDDGAPLDSVRSDANGRYTFAYRTTRDSAVYFASAMYSGVAYFTAPFSAPVVRGEAAELMVFDTSSTAEIVATRSRHVIVFNAAEAEARRMAEVYWLENVGALTRVAGTSGASWSSLLPTGATQLTVDGGDVPADAVSLRDGRVVVTAPIAPGLRQVQVSYTMPVKNFPLSVPMADSTMIVEVLVEDPQATVRGGGVVAQAPVNVEGRTFQRFLAQDVPPGAILDIRMGGAAASARNLYLVAIISIVAVALLLGLARAVMSSGGMRMARRAPPDQTSALAHAIAALDARFEKLAAPSDAQREAYETRRAELKRELTDILAARDDQL